MACREHQLQSEALDSWARRWQSFYRGGAVAVYIAVYALGFLLSSLSTLAGELMHFARLCTPLCSMHAWRQADALCFFAPAKLPSDA
eukprot:scaffold60307_cov17-Tisochrysis_lutea.AAC.1